MNFLNDPYAGYPAADPYQQEPVPTAARATPEKSRRPAMGQMSEGERVLWEAQQAQKNYTPQMDEQARRLGYRNYAEMIARQRERQIKGAGSMGQVSDREQGRPANPHPSGIFDYITSVLRNATGR